MQFNKGKAILNDAVVDKRLGLKASEIVRRLETDFRIPLQDEEGAVIVDEEGNPKTKAGYKIKLIEGDDEPKVETPKTKKGKELVPA